MAKELPKFKNHEEEVRFWKTADIFEYTDPTELKIDLDPALKRTMKPITIRLRFAINKANPNRRKNANNRQDEEEKLTVNPGPLSSGLYLFLNGLAAAPTRPRKNWAGQIVQAPKDMKKRTC